MIRTSRFYLINHRCEYLLKEPIRLSKTELACANAWGRARTGEREIMRRFFKLNLSVSKCGWGILLAILSLYVCQICLLSQSWTEAAINNLDDFHTAEFVRQYQLALLNGDTETILTQFSLAYGSLHWLFSALMLLPFYFLKSQAAAIIAGRALSLFCASISVLVVGKIAKRFTEDKFLIFSVMISVATLPVIGIWCTILHANIQYVTMGLISFYFLIAEEKLTNRNLFLSAVSVGFCVGLKLVGALISPLLAIVLVGRLWRERSRRSAIQWFVAYALISIPIAFFSVRFIFFDFSSLKFFLNDTVATVKMFASLGTPLREPPPMLSLMMTALQWHYYNALNLLVLFYLALRWSKSELKNRRIVAAAIVFTTLIDMTYIAVTVRKVPFFSASYLMGICFLMPLALLGLETFKITKRTQHLLALLFICLELLINFRQHYGQNLGHFSDVYSADTQKQLAALRDMQVLLKDVHPPLSVTVDRLTAFPFTSFDAGVNARYNFANLFGGHQTTFDYVVLNTKTWAVRGPAPEGNFLGQTRLQGDKFEASIRQELEQNHILFGTLYTLIYAKNDVELFQRVK